MVECVDCKSNDVVSKGFREGTEIRRYVCKACGRNFSIKPIIPVLVESEMKEEPIQIETETIKQPEIKEVEVVTAKPETDKANQTLNVRKSTKELLLSLKVHTRETIDDIILRLISQKEVNQI